MTTITFGISSNKTFLESFLPKVYIYTWHDYKWEHHSQLKGYSHLQTIHDHMWPTKILNWQPREHRAGHREEVIQLVMSNGIIRPEDCKDRRDRMQFWDKSDTLQGTVQNYYDCDCFIASVNTFLNTSNCLCQLTVDFMEVNPYIYSPMPTNAILTFRCERHVSLIHAK